MEKDPARRRLPLADRNIEVIDETMTGEVLLDEALKMMKQSEKMSVGSWIDLMSGKAAWHNRFLALLTRVLPRRDVELDEDRISAQASP